MYGLVGVYKSRRKSVSSSRQCSFGQTGDSSLSLSLPYIISNNHEVFI